MYEKNYQSARIKGKLRVYNYLISNRRLSSHIPHTVSLTLANLKYMSQKYKSIYIKLDVGSLGIGVYKVVRLFEGFKLYATYDKKQTQRQFQTISDLYRQLKSEQHKKLIIQKDVLLDYVDGRPYDIRVMVQRRPGGSWTCTGYMVKVGAPNKIVTNYYQGGQIITLDKLLLKKGYSETQKKEIPENLNRKALEVAKTLSRKCSGMHEMGIDFAYDRNQRLWLLEVNSNQPEYYPLKWLDPAAFRRINSFARSYGRV